MVVQRGLPVGVTEVTVARTHRCALAAGQVWCWGRGGRGELGQGVRHGSERPVRVEGLAGVRHIEAAHHHTCAVDGAGQVHCWGGNMYGQLGDGTRMSRPRPVPVEDVTGVIDVRVDDAMTCAVRSEDTICWGQGAWHAFDEAAEFEVPEPLPPTRVEGIGEEISAPPPPVVVDVTLP